MILYFLLKPADGAPIHIRPNDDSLLRGLQPGTDTYEKVASFLASMTQDGSGKKQKRGRRPPKWRTKNATENDDDGKRTACPLCPETFKHPHWLKNHMRIHTGEKPFKCPHCPRTFTHYNSHKFHVQRHFGSLAMPYRCLLCDKVRRN